MTFFDGFHAVVGLLSVATIIFWIVGRVDPKVREDEITEWLYDFLFNTDLVVDEVYESE